MRNVIVYGDFNCPYSYLASQPDLARIAHRSGGGIGLEGGPLTTAGWRRIRRGRQEWLTRQVFRAVIGPDQAVRSGAAGLRYPADLAAAAGVAPTLVCLISTTVPDIK